MEIFDHWWEYFRVLYWCVFPRPVDELLTESVSFQDLEKEYKTKANKIIKLKKDKRDSLLEMISSGVTLEEDRRTVIDTKASSMISQTGLAVTLIIASLSLVSLSVKELLPKVFIVIQLCFAAVNLIAAGLHARHVVSLRYPYPRHDFASYLGTAQPSADYIVCQLFIIQRLSQINDVKGTFLRFSHWFYKATFVTLFVIILSAPVLLFSNSIGARNPPSVVNSEIGKSQGIHNTRDPLNVVRDSTQAAHTRSKADSLKVKGHKKSMNAK